MLFPYLQNRVNRITMVSGAKRSQHSNIKSYDLKLNNLVKDQKLLKGLSELLVFTLQ